MCAAAWMVSHSIYVYVLAVHVPTPPPTNEAAGPRSCHGGSPGCDGGRAPQRRGVGQTAAFFYHGATNPTAAPPEDCSVYVQ